MFTSLPVRALSMSLALCLTACEASSPSPTTDAKAPAPESSALQALVAKTKKNLVFVEGGTFQMGDFGMAHNATKLPHYGALDWYDAKYYANSPILNPKGPKTGAEKVTRGQENLSPEGMEMRAMTMVRLPDEPGPTKYLGYAMRCIANSAKKFNRDKYKGVCCINRLPATA